MDIFCSVVVYEGGGGGRKHDSQTSTWLNSFHQWLWPSASPLPASSQRPGQVAEVDRAAQAGVRLQQGHDDSHGRLVVAGAARTGVVHDVYAQVGVVACTVIKKTTVRKEKNMEITPHSKRVHLICAFGWTHSWWTGWSMGSLQNPVQEGFLCSAARVSLHSESIERWHTYRHVSADWTEISFKLSWSVFILSSNIFVILRKNTEAYGKDMSVSHVQAWRSPRP